MSNSTPVTINGALVSFDPVVLKGDPGGVGTPGATGPAGAATDLTIGTVTSVPDGQSASASITGTAPNKVLNLVLVDGPEGPGGDPTVIHLTGDTDPVFTAEQEGDAHPRIEIYGGDNGGIFLGDGTSTATGSGASITIDDTGDLILGGGGDEGNVVSVGTLMVETGGTKTSVLSSGVTASTHRFHNPVTDVANGAFLNSYAQDDVVLATRIDGDDFPRWLMAADATDGFYFGDGTIDPYADGAGFNYNTGITFFSNQSGGRIRFETNNGPVTFDGGLNFSVDVDGNVSAGATLNGSGLTISGGVVTLQSLPTADPHVADQLWSNLGILTVSAG